MTLAVWGNYVSVNYSKSANRTIKASKAFSVYNAVGTVSYKKVSSNGKIAVASNGKMAVKKDLRKGAYNVQAKVGAAGKGSYNPGSETVTVTVRIK